MPFEKLSRDPSHQRLEDAGSEVAWDQSGFAPMAEAAFQAVAFLTGRGLLSLEQVRRALWEHDGDIEAAALAAYGLKVDANNKRALTAVMGLQALKKAEVGVQVEPAHIDAEEAAEELQRAFLAGASQDVTLNGKHSKGTVVAKDPTTGHVYLIKPGSGAPSPAAGVTDSQASQSHREVAFWRVADEIGLGNFFPRADLVKIGGKECAALRLLPYEYKTLDKKMREDPNYPPQVLERYRKAGVLHKWAILDYILGNPDRHGQNIMVNPDGEVALIDHGSAFAGHNFDPAHDQNSFIPFYLRAWVRGMNFNKMDANEKLRKMPQVSDEVNRALKEWVNQINVDQVERILKEYGIDPEPVFARLERIKTLAMMHSMDIAVNMVWATT